MLLRQYMVHRLLRKLYLRQLISASTVKTSTQSFVESSASGTHDLTNNDACYARLGDLSFSNTEEAFRSKTNWEIIRSLVVLKLCSVPAIVERNAEIMKISRKILGKRLFRRIMKLTFYGHFVAGEDEKEVEPVCQKMRKFGVKSILDYSVEADLSQEEAVESELDALSEDAPLIVPNDPNRTSEDQPAPKKFNIHYEFLDRREDVASARTYFYQGEAECDRNAEIFCNSIDQAVVATNCTGFVAIKLTALGRPQFLLQLSSVIAQAQQFYRMLSGSPWEEMVQARVSKELFLQKLQDFGIKTDPVYVKEWFAQVDFDNDGFVDIFEWSKLLTNNFKLSKMFEVINLKTGQMEPLMTQLTEDEEEMFLNMMSRLQRIADYAREKDVRVMIDAEQSYFQPAISRLTLELMRKYNKETPLIFNTYQCYLKNAAVNLNLDIHLARREDFCLGIKLVRGAYMEQERKRAKTLGYEDPIQPTYESTSENYRQCVEQVIQEATARPIGTIAAMCATHNEDSVRYIVKAMREHGIGPEQRVLCFGQLYGMCDQVSFTLGQAGYSVYKYVPYGPVDEVLPYLSRRAVENSGIILKAQRERGMLRDELLRRLRRGKLRHPPAYPNVQYF